MHQLVFCQYFFRIVSFDFPQSYYDAIQSEKDRLENIKTNRASAKAKLMAGEPLSEAEAEAITS